MKKVFGILNAALIAATLISAYCYYEYGGLWLKSLTSSGFVITGLINLLFAFSSRAEKKLFSGLMASGLLLCMIGDVVINLEFIPGALIFAIGHIFYFGAYCGLIKPKAKDFVPCLLIFCGAVAILLLYPGFDFVPIILAVCLFYALIISFMAGKAISNFIRCRGAVTSIILAGSVLFFISDLALVLYMFGNADRTMDTICLLTYFPAQCLLAFSIFKYDTCKTEA